MLINDQPCLDIPPFFFRRTVSVAPSSELLQRDASRVRIVPNKNLDGAVMRACRDALARQNPYGVVTAEYLHIVYSEYANLSKKQINNTRRFATCVIFLS